MFLKGVSFQIVMISLFISSDFARAKFSTYCQLKRGCASPRHLGWINKRSARNFPRDRMGSPPRSVVFFGFWNVYLELIFITVAFEAIEQWPACKSSADCAIYKRFGQRLFCFDCLFTNLQVPGPPIADSWHITFSRRKWRHI